MHRLRRAPHSSRWSTSAEAHPVRRHRVLPRHRLREASARSPTRSTHVLLRRHRAHLGPRGRRRPSEPCRSTRTGHHDDDPQDAARPARWYDPVACRDWPRRRSTAPIFPGMQGGPLMHVIAGKAVAFKEALAAGVQDATASRSSANAQARSGRRHRRTMATSAVSGGTDNHLFLLSLVDQGHHRQGGADLALDRAGITANKNMVPFDPRKPMVTSGVRIGTPAVTTRGMRRGRDGEIAGFIHRVLEPPWRRRGPWTRSARRRDAVPTLPALYESLVRRGPEAGACAVPSCGDEASRVDRHPYGWRADGEEIRRRRECEECGFQRFTTRERVEQPLPQGHQARRAARGLCTREAAARHRARLREAPGPQPMPSSGSGRSHRARLQESRRERGLDSRQIGERVILAS